LLIFLFIKYINKTSLLAILYLVISMMKKILLFGAGKSATCLIDYLIKETASRNWLVTVGDGNLQQLQSKINNTSNARGIVADVQNESERKSLISEADIVISLLPPALHFLVAKDCIEFNKNLLTASYIDEKIKNLEQEIKNKNLFFLCEMGLDPGIDHMSAMEIINRIKKAGGKITSFKSHTGGLIAPESDDNPWHYKISWNPRNVVMAGSSGAVYKENNTIINKNYQQLFSNCNEVEIPHAGNFAYYPNRDSLSYIPVYNLEDAETFLRTTLRYPIFCKCWKIIVDAGLTNDTTIINTTNLTYKKWSEKIVAFINDENKTALNFLGLFEEKNVPVDAKTNADILQNLLETKLIMQPHDKDMIVMLHEFEYEKENKKHKVKSHLIVKGENNIRTAMAKTVGLPLGIAAILLLEKKINLTGLHIPILQEIYTPVLEQLKKYNISFSETVN
jgi:saccharopine dehydrogenase-like NADP-dependent oxidoreductase